MKCYDIDDVLAAGHNLEPLKCRHCGAVGECQYYDEIGDAYCDVCGNWQYDEEADYDI